jgi:hypothetical protein
MTERASDIPGNTEPQTDHSITVAIGAAAQLITSWISW